jgi:predicted TIM-barrel fold metal-dependent hydrolase
MQGFYSNGRIAYPLCRAINDRGAIALFHTGQTEIRDEIRPKVLKANARKLLNIQRRPIGRVFT